MNWRLTAAALAAGLVFSGCGYSLSPSPYGLMDPLTVSVPLVANQSRFAELGPKLTSDIITRLNASPQISVREGAAAQLHMSIKYVRISGGAWQAASSSNVPLSSASRVVSIAVEAVLERPNPKGGPPLVRRNTFASSRNFLVTTGQAQVELLQNEAFDWIITDLGQKIAQTMFSEF